MGEDQQEKPLLQHIARPIEWYASEQIKNQYTDNADLNQMPSQKDLDDAFELAVWRRYEELEPRLRDVNKMLADS